MTAERSLTVFHINTERTFRGGEVQTLMLARELEDMGHRNFLFVQKCAPLAEKARAHGLPVEEMAMRGEWDVFAAWRIRTAMPMAKPDILHAHTPHAGALALLARFGLSHPAVVLSRRVMFPIKKNSFSRWKYRAVDALLAVSHAVAEVLKKQGLPPGRVFVAESGTDFSAHASAVSREQARRNLGIAPEAFVIGNVAQFDGKKGQAELVEAFANFVGHLPSALLLLAGDGPGLPDVRALAERKGVSGQVLFAGRRDDLTEIYAAMDVFFLASAMEGWSGVLTEAMGCGLPCLAVRSAVTEERIRHGKNGWLMDAKRPDAWMETMKTLFHDVALRKRLGEAGRAYAMQFTPRRLAEKTLECYRAVLEKRA